MKRRSGWARGKRRLAMLEELRPGSAAQLHRFVGQVLGLRVPRRALVAGNSAPFEYLVHTFFEGSAKPPFEQPQGPRQAAATMLDLLFKPGIQVRILAGSLEQASRMYEYLLNFARQPMLRGVLAGEPTQRRLQLVNGSRVTVSTQSPRAIRGQHVHKLRCDEVELLKRDMWQAAQMVPLSGALRGRRVRGAIEALSTMHEQFGIMRELTSGKNGPRVLRWSALDVAERCPPARLCSECRIEPYCRGLAKHADGFLAIDDLIEHRRRTSDDTWDAEMMCRQPRQDAMVYRQLNPQVHLRDFGLGARPRRR